MSYLINGPDPVPHTDLMPDEIALRSPLEIEGAFLFILQDRFTQAGIPWTWNEQVNLSKISVELGGHRSTTTTDPTPAVWIQRGQIVYSKVVVGDIDQNQPANLRKRMEHFYATGECDLRIECESKRAYESAEIADYVGQFLHKSSNIIQAVFAFYDMSPVILSRTRITKEDEEIYTTDVSFRISWESRWATIPAAPSMKRLTVQIAQSGGTTSEFLRDFLLKRS